ncbi:chemotaxis protein histidine kinase-like protein [Leptolyngbyaceae cyanobacterium JSC-12]|nr:chemotaxis protein histidine kinase-like protein [Leptolyngbyaceae cyanobacterium JSC-12]
MAINSDIRSQAYQFFLEEAPELLQVIESGLLTLTQDRSTTKIHNLMRAAHSIKGGSASVGLEVIATLAHRLEAIFKALYGETLIIDTELETQLLQAFDCLRLPLMEQLTNGGFNSEMALAIADPIFTQIETRCGDALTQAETYIPSSSELGIDMVTSIFDVDVAQGLERLANVVASPQNYEVAGELRAQIEIFAGFAELLNLPQFGAIAATAQKALNAHPEKVLDITKLALTDFSQFRQIIIAGDRTQLKGPSPALIELANTPIPTSQSEESQAAQSLPELEEVNDRKDSDKAGLQPEIDTDAAIKAPSVLETAIQSIEQIFGNLPPLQVPPDSTEPIDVRATPASSVHVMPLEEREDRELQVSQSIDLYQYQSTDNTFLEDSTNIHPVEMPAAPALTVRVDADRLERMNNLVGELAINRDGLSLQNEQLKAALRELLSRFSRFQHRVNQLQELSDQMLVDAERYRYSAKHRLDRNSPSGLEQLKQRISNQTLASASHSILTVPETEFDSLEMDSYGVLHSQLQEILEDMVPLEETVEDISLFTEQSNQALEQQRQMLARLRDELIWARMLPLGEILNRFPRVLRDLSTTYHKPVNLKLTGTGVLVEKAILEKLYDPLLHLLRNAFDHGIEPPITRRQWGKPEQGQIEIRAYHKGNQTIIEVRDDGQGLDLERIRNRVIELGWLSPEQLANVSPDQLQEFIFEPGFSTAMQVSELSGRGVGLDVVRSQLRSIKGTVTVKSSPGEGTIFTLYLPFTLTIAKLVVCLADIATLALPTDGIEEIITPPAGNIRQLGAQRFLYWREQVIPVHRLASLVNYNCPLSEVTLNKSFTAIPAPKAWALPMLILRGEQHIFAVEVDRLITEQELVIKPFSATITPPSYTYGCTVLGDGSLIPVIDAVTLLNWKQDRTPPAIAMAAESESPTVIQAEIDPPRKLLPSARRTMKAPTVLVVDDSATLRRTLSFSLKRAGFRVLQAQNGQEALAQLQQSTSVQLIICDIEMPTMNGFEFLTYRRQDSRLSVIPIVMLTSRSNDKHRWLATQLGADAYFTKPFLEQDFLSELENIIRDRK